MTSLADEKLAMALLAKVNGERVAYCRKCERWWTRDYEISIAEVNKRCPACYHTSTVPDSWHYVDS